MSAPALPASEKDVADAIADALRAGEKLAIVGGGSKAKIGAPVAARALPMAGLAGVVDYDPAELVLTVRPGTPLAEVQALVDAAGQMLAFEPFDHGPIFGEPEARATIGGVIAAGVSGSQRVSAGAARDHLLGIRAVSGKGEIFAAGAKVVKNVTGFDLPKLAAGSWGRLFAITELTLKVLPRPREAATCMLEGLAEAEAIAAMSRAMGSQADVAAAAYFPAANDRGQSATILRIQGFEASVAARRTMIDTLLAPVGAVRWLGPDEASAMWRHFRSLELLGEGPLWRINLPPTGGVALLEALGESEKRYLLDWAGGLIWIVTHAEPQMLRAAAQAAGGHAQLIRAAAEARARIPAFHPPQPGIATLEERVRRAFDPVGVFETGRF